MCDALNDRRLANREAKSSVPADMSLYTRGFTAHVARRASQAEKETQETGKCEVVLLEHLCVRISDAVESFINGYNQTSQNVHILSLNDTR